MGWFAWHKLVSPGVAFTSERQEKSAVPRSCVLAGTGSGTGCDDPRLAHFIS